MTFYYCQSPTLFTSPMPFLSAISAPSNRSVSHTDYFALCSILSCVPTAPALPSGNPALSSYIPRSDCELYYCFPLSAPTGIPTSKHTLPQALEKLAELVGVHHIKIHALRYSHASLLISMGAKPLLSKERLGHEKIQTTLGTYGHLYPSTNLEVANKLTGVL